MKKAVTVNKINTIAEYHRFMELPKPQHPLISVVKFEDIQRHPGKGRHTLINNFYSVALKRTFNAQMTYGQKEYDFDSGVLAFIAPKQRISVIYDKKETVEHSGWLLLVHPDFLWNTALSKSIKGYDFFGYSLNEALHLSDREEDMLTALIQNIELEYLANIDQFSQNVIIAQLDLLLNYAERFYHRQFLTRKKENHQILERLEEVLKNRFRDSELEKMGIPTVSSVAESLNLSANYLGTLLKTLTNQTTQQHIHNKLIERAKEKLSTSELSVSEIAYSLGFEHPQSFSKLFKSKTELSPLAFRQSFN